MKKIEIYAKDRNLDTVTITSGRNGYPSALRDAVVFNTQDEAESFAREIGGDVVLLQRRDGWQYYEELGTVIPPYEFGRDFTADDMKYGADQFTYTVRNVDDYRQALEEENDLIREITEEDHEPELIEEDADIVKILENFEEGDVMFVGFINGHQFYDTFCKGQTRWHDADVSIYCLAVTCDDEWDDHFESMGDFCDYFNKCADLPSRYNEILAANGWTDGGSDCVCFSDDEEIEYSDAAGQYECREKSNR